MNEDLKKQIIGWRRDFHKYPETGFLEMRTASKIAAVLDYLGFQLQMGKEVMDKRYCMGKPSDEETKKHAKWARENGADLEYLHHFEQGFTGIVAIWDTGKKGPTIAVRVDMDALDIHETLDENHNPNAKDFRSVIQDKMHACGHDAHMAIGLGLATMIAENKEQLQGKIKLIFQPAEEGTRGAKSMVRAKVVDDVDYFIAIHIGTGVPHRHFVASNNGFFATSKLDIMFKGEASHAGGKPEEGKNALLAAANAAMNIYAISRHSDGATRVNVGELHAGSGRNIIPQEAMLKVETRGETSAVNEYMKEKVEQIVKGAAHMYENDVDIELVGEGISVSGSVELARILHETAKSHPNIAQSHLTSDDNAGSEDATFFMEAVQQNGGLATYCIFGTELAGGHHNEKFDMNEETMFDAVDILFNSILKLANQGRD